MVQSSVVETPSGKLKGLFLKSSLGDDYYAFKGIPYAKPPIGSRRFQDSEPLEPWSDLRDATKYGSIAAQFSLETNTTVGSEDCLYLNVFTRNVHANARLPVMLWIHGGGFLFGSGDDDMFEPDFFMRKDVVLVTINYRLGIFGFLNLEDKVAPGNQGLKDQVVALQWVQKNIQAFGGDPDNVTIFGGSAGSAAVHYLSMSPLSKGLFHKAICQSGCAFNPWALKKKPKESLYELLEDLGYKERDAESIVTFLKTVDYNRLVEAQNKLMTALTWIRSIFPFGPGIDDTSDKPFLPVSLPLAAEKGIQVPLMIGYNSLEGLMTLNFMRTFDLKDVERNFENYIYPWTLDVLEPYGLTLQDLKKFYLKNEEISEHNMKNLIELYGDVFFIEGLHRQLKLQVENSAAPTYLYKLSFDKNLTYSMKQLNTEIKGVNHGDELNYLFKAKLCEAMDFNQLQKDTGGERVMQQMIEMWTNFAKTGRPTPEVTDLIPLYWQPLNSGVLLRYLSIDEDLRMEKDLSLETRYSSNKTAKRFL